MILRNSTSDTLSARLLHQSAMYGNLVMHTDNVIVVGNYCKNNCFFSSRIMNPFIPGRCLHFTFIGEKYTYQADRQSTCKSDSGDKQRFVANFVMLMPSLI